MSIHSASHSNHGVEMQNLLRLGPQSSNSAPSAVAAMPPEPAAPPAQLNPPPPAPAASSRASRLRFVSRPGCLLSGIALGMGAALWKGQYSVGRLQADNASLRADLQRYEDQVYGPSPAEPTSTPTANVDVVPVPAAVAQASAPKASDAEISARLGFPGTAFENNAAAPTGAPMSAMKPAAAPTGETRDQRLDDFIARDLARNGSLVVKKSIEPATSQALFYLSRSPSFLALVSALAHGKPTMIVPVSLSTDDVASALPDSRTQVADEHGVLSDANIVEWSPNLGRVAQRGPDADGQIICERQSPAVELMRRLFVSYGASRHPLTSNLLACIDDPVFGNQDAYRVNRKINRGLRAIDEFPAQYLGRRLDAANGVTEHGACEPKPDPLLDDARGRFPALEDPNAGACSKLYRAPWSNLEDVDSTASDSDASSAVLPETLRLSNATLADVERLKARSHDLEIRVAAAARENGTSPLAFMDEIRANREATHALLADVQSHAGFALDPNFDVSVREVIYHPAARHRPDVAGEAPEPSPEAPAAATAPAARREPQSLREAMMRGVGHDGPSQKVITDVTLKPAALPPLGVR